MARQQAETLRPLEAVIKSPRESEAAAISERRVQTPINAERLEYHLKKCNYPQEKTRYLVEGFKWGFKLGHSGNPVDLEANNSKKAELNPEVIEKKLDTELSKGRIAGPFVEKPFPVFQVSPLNVREKSVKNTFRLIHDLAHPYDDNSVNAKIPQGEKTVKYSTIRDAVKKLSQLPKGAYLAKCDIADAYRIIPVHPSEYPKLGMKYKGMYYYDKFLPQGCGSSCRIFEAFSTALQAIFEYYNPGADVQHMIDDFLFLAITQWLCQRSLDSFASLCEDIGVPLAPEKTTTPATWVVFLGFLLDSIARTTSLPADKVEKYSEEVEHIITLAGRISRKQLESVVGKLNFAAAVVPARPFLFRLSKRIYSVSKPYHWIKVTKEMREDLKTWLEFLRNYNGITFFRSLKLIPSDAIRMASDASFLGFGGCYGSNWVQAKYPVHWRAYGITFLELYPIFVLISMFGHLISNSSIQFRCDNMGVVEIIKSQSSSCPRIMTIMRPLTLLLIKFNIYLTALHIEGKKNIVPDLISRFKITEQVLRANKMKLRPSTLPSHLLPENFGI